MSTEPKKITIKASEAEWAAMCFYAAQGICQSDDKKTAKPAPWQPMASKAMALVERTAKKRVPSPC